MALSITNKTAVLFIVEGHIVPAREAAPELLVVIVDGTSIEAVVEAAMLSVISVGRASRKAVVYVPENQLSAIL
ncbi:hypothetical protein HBI71_000280 [Parastagonospora nodorum]|nr:hypothetical protein HBI71_000280 [Parastagonospora nodorum]KAH5424824.1 hypothetical protein HBI47_121600 [Parastagonospora nodorum]